MAALISAVAGISRELGFVVIATVRVPFALDVVEVGGAAAVAAGGAAAVAAGGAAAVAAGGAAAVAAGGAAAVACSDDGCVAGTPPHAASRRVPINKSARIAEILLTDTIALLLSSLR